MVGVAALSTPTVCVRIAPGTRNYALRTGVPPAPCKGGSPARHRGRALDGRLLCRQGPPGFDPGVATLVRVQPGQRSSRPHSSMAEHVLGKDAAGGSVPPEGSIRMLLRGQSAASPSPSARVRDPVAPPR